LKVKLVATSLMTVVIVACSLFIGPIAEGAAKSAGQAVRTPESSDFRFILNRLPENPSKYSLVISDSEERSISGSFSIDQLQVLRAIMTESEKFALSEEGVNLKDPVTTRFADKQERSFMVDVQKIGNQSLLFLTLNTELGRMTMDAGRVFRSTHRHEGFFFDLLSHLETMLPKPPARPSK